VAIILASTPILYISHLRACVYKGVIHVLAINYGANKEFGLKRKTTSIYRLASFTCARVFFLNGQAKEMEPEKLHFPLLFLIVHILQLFVKGIHRKNTHHSVNYKKAFCVFHVYVVLCNVS